MNAPNGLPMSGTMSLLGRPGAGETRANWLRTVDLEPWLDVGDPLAEAVVTGLRARQIGLKDPIPAIRRLAAGGDAACRDFLLDVETPEEWVDFERMRPGVAMVYRHFPQFLIAILHGGLMTTFCSADAAFILAGTNRLEQNVVRRVFESASLFFGVLESDTLRAGGSAWEACVRVRLLHTMVRLHLLEKDAWPLRGTPINALSTATGPLFFGAMILDRLRSLGAYITPAEADGYHLLWRHVTRLLGVPRELVGETAQEQAVLDARITSYAFDPDDNSRKLAGVLLSGFKQIPGTKRAPRVVNEVLVRYMLGEEWADNMGIRPRPLGIRVIRAAARVLRAYGWAQRIPWVAERLERFGRYFLNRMQERGLAGVPADYQP